jgi:hypothetical protein
MKMVAAFNKDGVAKFRSFLEQLQGGADLPIPYEYLDDPSITVSVDGFAEIDEGRVFGTRLEAGAYFCKALGDLRETEHGNMGMWAWLSLVYFDQVCPPLVKGQRKPGKVYSYIPSQLYTEYYRHKLLGPFSLYKLHGEYGAPLLCNPLYKVGEINEQIASRQTIVANVEMMKAVYRLYYDDEEKTHKRGATSREKAGSVNRFWRVKEQLDLTYDFFSMSCDDILQIFPLEFSSWWK